MNPSSIYPIFYIVLFLFILVSCQHPDNQLKSDAYQIDLTTATDSAELFAGNIISTRLNDRDMSISTDGTEIYYSVTIADNSVMAIVGLTKVGDSWTNPEVVSFSGEYKDIEPFLSPDGNKLFFSSNRPTNEKDSIDDFNIWYTERFESRWKNPVELGVPVNSNHNEFYPAVCENGNLYFTGSLKGSKGAEDIFLSEFREGIYHTPVSLDSSINSKNYEFNAYVSPNEDLIIFSSYGRTDGYGGGDLYFSRRNTDGNWSEARNMGPVINSEKLDYCAFPDTERGIFYFTSNRSTEPVIMHRSLDDIHKIYDRILNGQGNIYRINMAVLNL